MTTGARATDATLGWVTAEAAAECRRMFFLGRVTFIPAVGRAALPTNLHPFTRMANTDALNTQDLSASHQMLHYENINSSTGTCVGAQMN